MLKPQTFRGFRDRKERSRIGGHALTSRAKLPSGSDWGGDVFSVDSPVVLVTSCRLAVIPPFRGPCIAENPVDSAARPSKRDQDEQGSSNHPAR